VRELRTEELSVERVPAELRNVPLLLAPERTVELFLEDERTAELLTVEDERFPLVTTALPPEALETERRAGLCTVVWWYGR
jgi:hypothetical protein